MKFTKMHGAGNDFVVIETDDNKRDWPSFARTICDRHFGIGADTLLLSMPSSSADLYMSVFDADGSVSEACGNGLRCIVKYYLDSHPGKREVTVETMAGLRAARVYKTARGETRIQAGMGKPVLERKDIPVNVDKSPGKTTVTGGMTSHALMVDDMLLDLSFISMGNPHAVYFSREPVARFPLLQIGPKVENDGIFPNRTNFEVVRVLGRSKVEARVWERGAGATLACGSGACAITVAAMILGYTSPHVEVVLPGGALEVEWDGTGEVILSGPAETVFTGEWPDRN